MNSRLFSSVFDRKRKRRGIGLEYTCSVDNNSETEDEEWNGNYWNWKELLLRAHEAVGRHWHGVVSESVSHKLFTDPKSVDVISLKWRRLFTEKHRQERKVRLEENETISRTQKERRAKQRRRRRRSSNPIHTLPPAVIAVSDFPQRSRHVFPFFMPPLVVFFLCASRFSKETSQICCCYCCELFFGRC